MDVWLALLNRSWKAHLHRYEYAAKLKQLFRCRLGIAGTEGEVEKALLSMSTLNEEGVMSVKQAACDALLASRVEAKLQVRLGGKGHDSLTRSKGGYLQS